MPPHYHIEIDDNCFCVTCNEGLMVVFESMGEAVEAMREFEQKSFPEAWEKVPPATRYAKQLWGASNPL